MKFSNPKYRNEQLQKDLENAERILTEYQDQQKEHISNISKYSHNWSYLHVKFAESKTLIYNKEIQLLKKEVENIKNKLGKK